MKKKTLVIIAHPAGDQSSSQQFLVSSLKAWTDTKVKWLSPLGQAEGRNLDLEREELLEADRLILQFPLYWYQAPALLKEWLDWILDHSGQYEDFFHALAGKELGIVLSIGSQAINFQPGARLGRTIPDMLSPYEMLANYFKMVYLPPFVIEQFALMRDEERHVLMMEYVHYVETGGSTDFFSYEDYLLECLVSLEEELTLSEEEKTLRNLVYQHLSDRKEELLELLRMNGEW